MRCFFSFPWAKWHLHNLFCIVICTGWMVMGSRWNCIAQLSVLSILSLKVVQVAQGPFLGTPFVNWEQWQTAKEEHYPGSKVAFFPFLLMVVGDTMNTLSVRACVCVCVHVVPLLSLFLAEGYKTMNQSNLHSGSHFSMCDSISADFSSLLNFGVYILFFCNEQQQKEISHLLPRGFSNTFFCTFYLLKIDLF